MTEIKLHIGKKSATVEDGQEILIGRGRQCDLIFTADTVSLEHCKVVRNGDELLITDLGSTGTFINETRMEKGSSIHLNNGDKVHVSPNAGFVVIFEYDEIGFADETDRNKQ